MQDVKCINCFLTLLVENIFSLHMKPILTGRKIGVIPAGFAFPGRPAFIKTFQPAPEFIGP